MKAEQLLEDGKSIMEKFEKLSPEEQRKFLKALEEKKKTTPPGMNEALEEENGF
ncbi:MAG TPA: hypothetical protein VLB02_02300 [Candidatus Paceibacterota bacterium]|nr:hypothetical protein [Candidatus Paceibacterota bacterium]